MSTLRANPPSGFWTVTVPIFNSNVELVEAVGHVTYLVPAPVGSGTLFKVTKLEKTSTTLNSMGKIVMFVTNVPLVISGVLGAVTALPLSAWIESFSFMVSVIGPVKLLSDKFHSSANPRIFKTS
jgi:hypothetical protein